MSNSPVDLNGKTVLITGGAGFIGSRLALEIERRFPACRVVVFESFHLGRFENLRHFRGRCLAGDICCREDLARLEEEPLDFIFHQAANSDTRSSDQKQVLAVNTNAFADVLALAARHRAGVVYASSAAVYGKTDAPQRVGQAEAPENVYAFSKLMMDRLAADFTRRHDLPVVGLRYFNVYGPGEAHKGDSASMIRQLALQMLSGEPPRLFKWGEQRRDFVYVDDVVNATLLATRPRRSGVYNVGTGRARQFNEIVTLLQQGLGVDVQPQYFDNPWPFYQQHTEADIEPTQQELGFQPQFSLQRGIEDYLPHLLDCRP